MAGDQVYLERVSSNVTEALFAALMSILLVLGIWHMNWNGWDILSVVLFCLSGLFLFYMLNYRILIIRITAESVVLTFGIFTWSIPMENIDACRLDEIPELMRFGGAGIHFMSVRRRYRASFNFLEYPRVVISLRKNIGPVRDISFSTRRPDEILQLIQDAVSTKEAA